MLTKNFIKQDIEFNADFSYNSPAIRFRRKFNTKKTKNATIYVCGLGYGYYYINGKKVTEDLFTAPVSDYTKTIWYNKYDVSSLLKSGDNIFCAYLGNGWLNENFETPWAHNKAYWRDNPKLYVQLFIDDELVFSSDKKFLVKEDKCIYFNQLRSGEYWDYNYLENWLDYSFDDSSWKNAKVDNSRTGTLKECLCEPVRVCREYQPIKIIKYKDNFVFDFGQNISGFVRIRGKFNKGQEITLVHAEEIDENGNYLQDDGKTFFYNLNAYTSCVPFQTDKIISNGEYIEWSPLFTYHGFRYVSVSGLKEEPSKDFITALFVHNDIENSSYFHCDNELLNNIYKLGIMSTWSNMCYCLTDCPTREKLGWLNDAAASIDQVLLNFSSENLINKWIYDIFDSELAGGDVSGIAPAHDWGYNCGAVCTIAIAEIPYNLYLKTLNKQIIVDSLPYIEKHLAYYESTLKDDGTSLYWLGDWTGNGSRETPIPMIEKLLVVRFLKVIKIFRTILGLSLDRIDDKISLYKNKVLSEYVVEGKSKYINQTAISMLIVEEIGDFDKISKQLVEIINSNPIIDSGMIGIQYSYNALSKIGRPDLAVKIISNKDSFYSKWISDGATTFYESFDKNQFTVSHNHHMFSNVLSFFFRNIAGIKYDPILGVDKITIKPDFNNGISKFESKIKLPNGYIEVSKNNNELLINVIGNLNVFYNNKRILGLNKFLID